MAFPLQFVLENLLNQVIMGKDKKKNSKKDTVSEDVLDVARLSLKRFRKVTKEIGKLSTGQKLVGGLVLAAAGLVYLATKDEEGVTDAASEGSPTPHSGENAHAVTEAETEPAAPAKSRKKPKSH